MDSQPLVQTLDHRAIVDLILEADQHLCFCAPNLFEETAQALSEAAKGGVNTQVILDPTEEAYRHGFGSIEAIDILQAAGVDVRQHVDSMVSFIISDDTGYFLFPESRIFDEMGSGPNAVRMDPLMRIELISYYFPAQTSADQEERKAQFNRATEQMADEGLSRIKEALETEQDREQVETLDDETVQSIRDALDKNPPVSPDIRRVLNVYNTKLQFAEITFKGSGLKRRTVSIPSEALPFEDEELKDKLETRMRLFKGISFDRLDELKDKLTDIRDRYTHTVASRGKRVFRTREKADMVGELETLSGRVEALRQDMLNRVADEILNAQDRLEQALTEILRENPPEEMQLDLYGDSTVSRRIEREASGIISRVRFPQPEELVDNLDVEWYFYDLTWEDFKNQKFIKELKEADIIEAEDADELRSLKQAVGVQTNSSVEVGA